MVTDDDIRRYEGLVFKTATLLEGKVDDELDDICQLLRIKVWKALEAWSPNRSKLSQDRFVFSCLVNLKKDLLDKRRRKVEGGRLPLYIEDIAPVVEEGHPAGGGRRDKFEARHLSVDPEEVYGMLEEDNVLVPSTLTGTERRVVCLLYADYKQVEIAASLDLGGKEIERAMKSIRLKMADWRPAAQELDSDSEDREGVTT